MSFSQRHHRLVSPAADTAEEIRQRLIRRCAGERAVVDREIKFPELTPFNAAAALAYQEERVAFHERQLGAEAMSMRNPRR